jgi:hypothetical protein
MRGVACAYALGVVPGLRSPAPTKGSTAAAWAKREDIRTIAILPSISTARPFRLLVVGKKKS